MGFWFPLDSIGDWRPLGVGAARLTAILVVVFVVGVIIWDGWVMAESIQEKTGLIVVDEPRRISERSELADAREEIRRLRRELRDVHQGFLDEVDAIDPDEIRTWHDSHRTLHEIERELGCPSHLTALEMVRKVVRRLEELEAKRVREFPR